MYLLLFRGGQQRTVGWDGVVSVGRDQELLPEGEHGGGSGGAGVSGAEHQRAGLGGQPLSCKLGRRGDSAAAEGRIQTGQFKNM